MKSIKSNWLIIITPVMLFLIVASLFAQGSQVDEILQKSVAEDRIVNFAGLEWIVKSGDELGPGPNCWDDSEQSVWVEGGQLHLKIRQSGEQWCSAEVYSTTCTQYGMHQFALVGRPDNFDRNIVLGLFAYKDDDTEIDIEFAKWGDSDPEYNAQYVIQPWDMPGNREPFLMLLNGTHSLHYFDWQENEIQFKSVHGHDPNGVPIHMWQYTGDDIPRQEECLKIHMNLWLVGGNPPSDDEEAEIVIKHATFPPPYETPTPIPTNTPTPTDTPTSTITPSPTHIPTPSITPTPVPPALMNYLPAIFKQPPSTPTPTLTATPVPWVSVAATSNRAAGEVGPASYCNSNYKIALYAKTDIWYVQPATAEPERNVEIKSDCTWEADTNTWDQVAAHLVSSSYMHPNTINSQLPCPPPPLNPATNANILAASCFP